MSQFARTGLRQGQEAPEIKLDARTREILRHLSPSSYDQFIRCPAQWELVRIEGIKIPPAIAMLVGSGTHGAAEVNFKQKITSGVDLPVADFKDAAATRFRQEAEKSGVSVPRDELPALKRLLSDGRDRAIRFAECMAKEVAPTIQPIAVERMITIQDPSLPIPWVGVIDVATDTTLVDWKTAGKKWPAGRENRETQMTVYNQMYQFEYGLSPELGFGVFSDNTKSGALYDYRMTERTSDDWKALCRGAETMIRMIQADLFPPCPPGSWNCSQTYCGLWVVCPHISERLRRLPNV
jgi:hypothetical protein